jgi:hypothetical protein
LTQIKLSGVLLSEEFMEFIASHLPKIDTLEYMFEEQDIDFNNEINHGIVNLDLTQMKNLTTLNLNLGNIVREFDYLLFQFKYPKSGDTL